MKSFRTDRPLWLLATGLLCAAFLVAEHAADPRGSHVGVLLRTGSPTNPAGPRAAGVCVELLVLAVGLSVPGWVVQAIALRCGVRLGRTPGEGQAADYADAFRP